MLRRKFVKTGKQGAGYFLGPQLRRDSRESIKPYDSKSNVPSEWRAVWVYAVDPSLKRRDGETQKIDIPYEKVEPGPVGGLFAVDMDADGTSYDRVDLDSPDELRKRGIKPDEADARFHGQMVYAIASLTYEAFRKSLGRQPGWAFDNLDQNQPNRLTLAPFALRQQANAYYDRARRKICFGYIITDDDDPNFPPDKTIFTTLSSDVITHEVSHAILDGLRPYFIEPTSPDVPAFHEAFADLMAIFQRFNFRDFVRAQLRQVNGDLSRSNFFGIIAPELGYIANKSTGVRYYIWKHAQEAKSLSEHESPESDEATKTMTEIDKSGGSEHERGAVLAEAVFDAFVTTVQNRTKELMRIATWGRASLRDDELSAELLEMLVSSVQKIASHFRTICIRAVDYCPPVDVTFGDYLRAIITADAVLVPNDPHGYREAIVDAFRRRMIYPQYVRTMSEKALVWNAPQRTLAPIKELNLGSLRFFGDPGAVPAPEDTDFHAGVIARRILEDAELREEMGLLDASAVVGEEVEHFEVSSLRATRRVGPDGQISFDLVVEVVQARKLQMDHGRSVWFRGGATLILDLCGNIRFCIRKRVGHEERDILFKRYITSEAGKKFWTHEGELSLKPNIFERLCMCPRENEKDFVSRDIVGKSWVKVLNPPGVPTGTGVSVGGVDDLLTTNVAGKVSPGLRRTYEVRRADGVSFSKKVTVESGYTERDPFLVELVMD